MSEEEKNTPIPIDNESKAPHHAEAIDQQGSVMPTKKTRRLLRWLVRLLVLLVCILLVLFVGVWVWSGKNGSLAQAITLAQRFVPLVEQSLQVEGVEGTLRHGGSVSSLRWRQQQLDIELADVSLQWDLHLLWSKKLNIEHITADKVHVRMLPICASSNSEPNNAISSQSTDAQAVESTISMREETSLPLECVDEADLTPKEKNDQPASMPTLPDNFALPVNINLNLFQVNSFVYAQSTQQVLEVKEIQANYHYVDQTHEFQLVSLFFDRGNYEGFLSLTAFKPVLNAIFEGQLETTIPDSEQTAKMNVTVDAQGALTDLLLKAHAQASITSPNKQDDAQVGDIVTQVKNDPAIEHVPEVSPSASLEAHLTLWDQQILDYANINLQAFNLGALWSFAPQTLLSGEVQLTDVKRGGELGIQTAQLSIDINNTHFGALDKNLLPFSQLQISAALQDEQITLDQLNVQAGNASIKTVGDLILTENIAANRLPTLHVNTQIVDVDPHEIFSVLQEDRINGHLSVQHEDGILSYDLLLKALDVQLNRTNAPKLKSLLLRGGVAGEQVNLEELTIQSTHSDLKASAHLKLMRPVLELLTHSSEFNWMDELNKGVANAKIEMQTPGVQTLIEATDLQATKGHLVMSMKAPEVQKTLSWIEQLPGVPDVLSNFKFDGGFNFDGRLQGGWLDPSIDTKFETTELAISQLNATNVEALTNSAGDSSDEMVKTAAPSAANTNISSGEPVGYQELVRIKNTILTLQGNLKNATLTLQTGAKLKDFIFEVTTKAYGGLSGDILNMHFDDMNAVLKRMRTVGVSTPSQNEAVTIVGANFQNPVDVTWDFKQGRLSSLPGVLELRFADKKEMTSTVHWTKANLQNGVLDSAGTVSSFPVLWLLTFTGNVLDDFMLGGDMMLGGQWDLHTGNQPRFSVEIERTSGDLKLESTQSAFTSSSLSSQYQVGIRTAYIKLYNEGQKINAELLWDTERAGQIDVGLSTLLMQENAAWSIRPDAPLSGHITAQLPELRMASAAFPTGWRLDGAAIIDTEVQGTLNAPKLDGKLTALGVSLRSLVDGLSFKDGEIDLAFNSDEVRLNKFVFYGTGDNGGEMSAQGYFTVPEKGSLPVVEFNVLLKKLNASIHPDRQVTVSGDLSMRLKEKVLSLTGGITVDKALIIIDNAGAPSLDDDVVIVSGPYANNVEQKDENRPRRRDIYGIVPHLNLKLDLGKNLRVQGYGLQTYLQGVLELSNSGWDPILIGTVRTERGRFKAYGQHLTVEKGSIVFSGNPMNPSLDILAIRAQTSEKVGINILGTASHPQIKLYSESGLPESEILSWLLLGRSASSSGTEMAVLQQAAMALASGDGESITDQIAGSLGLDEISLGGSNSGSDDSLAGTTVTIGKRLSEDFYVTYEQGLHNAMGTFFLFYDISRRLTLRGEAGEDTAIDLIYAFRFDGWKN